MVAHGVLMNTSVGRPCYVLIGSLNFVESLICQFMDSDTHCRGITAYLFDGAMTIAAPSRLDHDLEADLVRF